MDLCSERERKRFATGMQYISVFKSKIYPGGMANMIICTIKEQSSTNQEISFALFKGLHTKLLK